MCTGDGEQVGTEAVQRPELEELVGEDQLPGRHGDVAQHAQRDRLAPHQARRGHAIRPVADTRRRTSANQLRPLLRRYSTKSSCARVRLGRVRHTACQTFGSGGGDSPGTQPLPCVLHA